MAQAAIKSLFEDSEGDLSIGTWSNGLYRYSSKENKYIFMADMWKPDSLMYSRYIWLPIDFDKAEIPVIEWKNSWKPAF